ncbi:hypothetical protein DFP72DRAFT_292937 [Ephemerocybe angulata]|uniref:Uncharacterized protein n=1 Tax=Ephemerocybe angulata TaxID=980116 RepID=A0A8H6H854_9AGAR|nr:hypothetical protein DFP72DRAFT_292937 [Tulosesus angulatus]
MRRPLQHHRPQRRRRGSRRLSPELLRPNLRSTITTLRILTAACRRTNLNRLKKRSPPVRRRTFLKLENRAAKVRHLRRVPLPPSRPGRGVSMKDFLKLLNPVSDTKQASPKKPQEPSSPVQVPTTSGPFDPKADPSVVRRCVTLPDVDEVNDPALQDPILAEQYVDLPRLRRGILIPWTDTPGKGFISFTKWAEWIPDMNAANAYGAVNFTQAGPIRNPARVSPLDVAMKNMGSNSQKFNFYCATNPPVPLIATSAGWVDRSQLLAPAEKGVRQKYISIILHSQEWQRTLGFIRTASGFTSLHGQLARNALQFSSRAQASRRTTAPAVPDADGTTREVPANMFVNDPTQNSASSSTVATDTFSLPNDATIPVYDARDAGELDFEKVLPRLSDELPLYTGGEIPFGSFVLLGYTMTIFLANNNNWTLGCNILWVVLIGSP